MKNCDKPFFCYSKKLKEELSMLGIRYLTRSVHEKTGRPYWVYSPTVELNAYLEKRRSQYE